MKPSKLNIFSEEENYCKDKILLPYLDKDCVVAYNKNKAIVVFLIKSAKTYMGFYYVSKELAPYQKRKNRLRKITMEEAFKLIEGEGIILDKNEYSQIRKKLILKNLKYNLDGGIK